MTEEQIRAIHYRVADVDPFAKDAGHEQYMVHCACTTNEHHLWQPSDPEPDWKCKTLKALEANNVASTGQKA